MSKIIKNRNFVFLFAFVIFVAVGYYTFPVISQAMIALERCVEEYNYCLNSGDDIYVEIINEPDPYVEPVNCRHVFTLEGGDICYTITSTVDTGTPDNKIVYRWGSADPSITLTTTIKIISKPANVTDIYSFSNSWAYDAPGTTYNGYNAICDPMFPLDTWDFLACLMPPCYYDGPPGSPEAEQCVAQGVPGDDGNTGGLVSTSSFTLPLKILRGGTQTFVNDVRLTFNSGVRWTQDASLLPGFSVTVRKYNYNVNPTSLTFGANQNGTLPAPKSIIVQNSSIEGSGLNISVSDNASWLTVTPFSLSLPNAGDPGAVNASINTTNLAPGTYNATIFFNDPNVVNNKTVNVSYTVSGSAAAPTLKAVWNETNSTTINKTVSAGGSITLPFTFSNTGNPGSVITVRCPKGAIASEIGTNNVTSPICPDVVLTVPIP